MAAMRGPRTLYARGQTRYPCAPMPSPSFSREHLGLLLGFIGVVVFGAAALTMPADVTHIALKPWLALFYVALFSQWIGFFAWNAGMAMGGIARVSQMQLLQPFITFALAALFNGETITPQILLFAAAVVVTVAISTRSRPRPVTAG